YFDFRERNRVFAGMAGLSAIQVNLTRRDGDPERIAAASVTSELIGLLGVQPLLGRGFRPEESRPGGAAAAVLSEGLWRRLYGADPGVLGRTMTLEGRSYQVIGVMPASFTVPFEETQLWIPAQVSPTSSSRGRHGFVVLARLRPGVTLQQAQQDMTSVAQQLEREYPGDNKGRGVNLVPITEDAVGDVRPALLVLFGSVALVLMIACANIANLMLARGLGRQKEVAIRTALGASSSRLVRQFLVEGLVLAAVAALVGAALAASSLNVLVSLVPQDIRRLHSVTLDSRVLVFTASLAIMTGVFFTVLPAAQTLRRNLQGHLNETGRVAASRGRQRVRSALVAGELALSVALVIGATLLLRSYIHLQQVDPGFNPAHVLKAELQLPASRYPQRFADFPNWPEVSRFYDRLLERLHALPGAQGAALAANHPLEAGFTTRVLVQGRPPETTGAPEEIRVRPISADYLKVAGVKLIRGRGLADTDRVGQPLVAMINEAAARRYFPGEDPIGKDISIFGPQPRTIIGIIANERFQGLGEETPPAIYPPFAQVMFGAASVLVRTTGDPMRLVRTVQEQVWAIDRDLAVFEVASLDSLVSKSLAQPRFNSLLIGVFGALALVLSVAGVYGLMSYVVSQRVHEIGLRMALGANRADVLRLVLTEALVLGTGGIVAGTALAAALRGSLHTLLYGITPGDPVTFVGVPLLLLAVALGASLGPAVRATRVDPMVALRAE
ncbi:MAG: ABC transporter permease, partial [Acidobacteria bacterium]|nr:ABC transporter permease [Acidobacteriota bacterium]